MSIDYAHRVMKSEECIIYDFFSLSSIPPSISQTQNLFFICLSFFSPLISALHFLRRCNFFSADLWNGQNEYQALLCVCVYAAAVISERLLVPVDGLNNGIWLLRVCACVCVHHHFILSVL